MIAHDLEEGEWVAQVPYFKPLQRVADYTPPRCRAILQSIIGSSDVPFRILSVRGYATPPPPRSPGAAASCVTPMAMGGCWPV